MLGFALDTGALAGLIAVLATVVLLALIVARITRRDQRIRLAQVGVFIRRERIDEVPPLAPAEPPPGDELDTREWPAPKRDPPLDR